jgi:hypothetical protein
MRGIAAYRDACFGPLTCLDDKLLCLGVFFCVNAHLLLDQYALHTMQTALRCIATLLTCLVSGYEQMCTMCRSVRSSSSRLKIATGLLYATAA